MLFAIAVVLSFDESVQAQIDGGEELHSFWVQAMGYIRSINNVFFGMNAKAIKMKYSQE